MSASETSIYVFLQIQTPTIAFSYSTSEQTVAEMYYHFLFFFFFTKLNNALRGMPQPLIWIIERVGACEIYYRRCHRVWQLRVIIFAIMMSNDSYTYETHARVFDKILSYRSVCREKEERKLERSRKPKRNPTFKKIFCQCTWIFCYFLYL